MRLWLFLVCAASAGTAQSVGVEGGLRLTGDQPEYGRSNSRAYLAGPAVEVRLPLHLGVEAEALYSRLGNTEYVPLIANESTIRTIANA